MKFEMLSEERVGELSKDYEVPMTVIHSLYGSLIQTINRLESDDVYCCDDELIDRLLEISIAIKSSLKSKKLGGSGDKLTNEDIVVVALYKAGIVSFDDFALVASKKVRR